MSRPGWSWLSVLLLTTCGGDPAKVRPCDRLGLLCAAEDSALPLGLDASRNVTADLDGDGGLDVITAAGAAGLSIAWRSDGSRDYHLLPGVTDAKIGDLDRDGHLDIAFLASDPAALHILRGTGTRKLLDGPTQPLAGRPQGLWLGRLDADDTLDAAVVSGDEATLTILTAGLTRARPIALGRDLVAVDAGDFDGDDRLDLVALDQADAAFHLVLATGDAFAAPRRVATGLAPRYLQILDHDGDGRTDVLTHGKGPEIWFHQGDGAGSFAAARPLVIQTQASPGFGAHRDAQGRRWLLTIDFGNLAATRLDDDDKPVGRVRGGGILQFTGLDMDGDVPVAHGTWFGHVFSLDPAHIFSERWHGGTYTDGTLELADLDQDGAPELVAAEDLAAVIYHQLPDASWAERTRVATDERLRTLAVAELTGDDRPDLALADAVPSLHIAAAADDGSFTLGPATPLLVDEPGLYPVAPPGGGASTLVVRQRLDDQFALFAYRPDGDQLVTTDSESFLPGTFVGLSPRVADVDGDGGDDLVVLARAADDTLSLVIVPGAIDGWGPPRTLPLSALVPGLGSTPDLAVGDLDQDGTIDAALLDTPRIIRFMDLAADPPPPPEIDEDALHDYTDEVVIADADADGRPDLARCSSNGLAIVLATADGWLPQPPFDSYFYNCSLYVDPTTLQPTAVLADAGALTILTPDLAPALAPTSYLTGGPAPFVRLATGDLDADGLAEIVVTAPSDDTPTGSTAVLWGHADGRPRRATWTDGLIFASATPALAPLDDRPGDELLLGWSDGTVEIWTHTADGLEKSSQVQLDLYGISALGAQARAHGPADLVVLGGSDGKHWSVVAVPRATDGSFLAEQAVPLATAPLGTQDPALTIADLDADGHDDLVVFSGPNLPVYLLWGDPQRASPLVTLPAPPGTYNVTSADMNGDGTPELVLGTIDGILGLAFPDREPQTTTYLKSTSEQGLLVADLEADGHADLLRTTDGSLNVTLRAPTGDDEHLQLAFDPPWQQLHAAHLDDDGILDLIGLVDGTLVTRRSAPEKVETP